MDSYSDPNPTYYSEANLKFESCLTIEETDASKPELKPASGNEMAHSNYTWKRLTTDMNDECPGGTWNVPDMEGKCVSCGCEMCECV